MAEEQLDKAPPTYPGRSSTDNSNVANELAGIRRALERIADRLDGWSSHDDHRLKVDAYDGE